MNSLAEVVSVARRYLGFALALLLSLTLVPTTGLAHDVPAETVITLIHDTHVNGNLMTGDVGLPHKVAAIKKIQASRPNSLWVGNGDDLGGSLLSTTFDAKQITDAWNRYGLAVDGVGNHEFDLGIDVFLARVRDSKFPWVTANARDKRTGDALGAEAGVKKFVIQMVGGVSVGFTGLTPVTTPTASSPGPNAEFLDYVVAMKEIVPQMKSAGAQVIVVLSHVCAADTKRVAEQVEGINAIVGDHCATVLEEPEVVGQTIISRVGDEYRYVGQLDLHVTAGKVTHFEFTRHALTKDSPVDADADKFVKDYTANLDAKLGGEVGASRAYLDSRKDANRVQETALSNYIADAMRAQMGAQVALHNGGGIRAGRIFAPGKLTKKDIVAILPFPNTIVKLEVTGEQLLAALENGMASVEKGAGAFAQVSGLTFRVDLTQPAGQRVSRVMVGSKQLDLKATYTLATTNFLQGGGDAYAMLKTAKVLIDANSGPVMSIAVMEQVQKDGIIDPVVEGRILYTAGVQLEAGKNEIRFGGNPIALDQGAVKDELGGVWVPLRAVAELYGYRVNWDAATGITTVLDRTGKQVGIARPTMEAMTRNGRTMVLLKFLPQALGIDATVNGNLIDLRLK